jgi:hypothetical protein
LVASSLPPAESGVAFFTQRSLCAPRLPVTFFAPVRGAYALARAREALARARHDAQAEPSPVDVLPLGILKQVRAALPSEPVLFVLGNSEHHSDTLGHLLTHGAGPLDAVHLHDIFLGGLLLAHFDEESALRAALLSAYEPHAVANWIRGGGMLQHGKDALLGPRLLVRNAGVKHFIVNSLAAADRLTADLGDEAASVRIDVAFLPILPSNIRPGIRDSKTLRVGHFGILGRTKQPERLIAACDLLAKRRRIQLVVAGYGVKQAVRVYGLEREYVVVEESPSEMELQTLMQTVDCAVQLRYPDHGESSGVVNQLLALRRPIVCTSTGSSAELSDAVFLVSPDVTPANLALEIERAAATAWPGAADVLVDRRSPQVFEDRLRTILGINGTAGVRRQRRDRHRGAIQ